MEEAVHREEFRLRAPADLEGRTVKGRVSAYLGPILIAEVALRFRVESGHLTAPDGPMEPDHGRMFRRIFASFAPADRPVADQFERFARAMGDEYLSSCTALRAGDAWDDRLRELIDGADVFQLFWSRNALRSPMVEREWRHALSLGRPSFIRPVYWEEPLPADPDRDLPPDELRRLHFQRLDGIGPRQPEGSSEGHRGEPERVRPERPKSSMTDPGTGVHLTELETSWTTIRTAHMPGPEGRAAMSKLLGRYHDVVHRYLQLKLRDPNVADEVFQEFWTKLLTHKLAGADHNKGRFRDYLRTVLHRLIIDHFRRRKLQALPPGDLLDPSQPDADYERVWREAVLKRALSRLETHEAQTPKNCYATILNLRREHPKESIEEIAGRLGDRLGTRITPESFRKTLQRARMKFFELLVQELRETIHPATDSDIEDEIRALGLGHLYRRASVHRAESRWSLNPRVPGQLVDPRMGRLRGKLTADDIRRLAGNPSGRRFWDELSNNINVIEEVDGNLLRVTVARDHFEVVSVGPIQERNIANYVGRREFIPLP